MSAFINLHFIPEKPAKQTFYADIKMKFTYLLINFFTILIPLLRSAEPKLRFYKKWKFIFPGMIATGAFFIIWDYFMCRGGVWSFNSKYILGLKFGGLPIEEYLFFITVPYACTFVYQAVSCFFNQEVPFPAQKSIVTLLSVLAFISSLFFSSKAYTFSVLFTAGLVFPVATYMLPGSLLSNFFITYLICLVPMLVVNGLLTSLPVVIYNDAQNLGFRIGTIPIEDFLYGAILLVMNIGLFQWTESRLKPNGDTAARITIG